MDRSRTGGGNGKFYLVCLYIYSLTDKHTLLHDQKPKKGIIHEQHSHRIEELISTESTSCVTIKNSTEGKVICRKHIMPFLFQVTVCMLHALYHLHSLHMEHN